MINAMGDLMKITKCFFRCLALHEGQNMRNLEDKTNQLLSVYNPAMTDFPGIELEDLRELEEMFNVNIHVYSLNYNTLDHR